MQSRKRLINCSPKLFTQLPHFIYCNNPQKIQIYGAVLSLFTGPTTAHIFGVHKNAFIDRILTGFDNGKVSQLCGPDNA